jgi:hypothetical protein
MTRLFYFILPLAAMLAFGGYYFGVFHKEQVAIEHAAEEKKKREEAEAKAAKVIADKKAQDDAKARADQKRDEERKKREDREKKQQEEDDKLKTQVTELETRATRLTKSKSDLEIQLAELRRSREAEQRKAFDARREVEQMKISRRNAELAIQLDTEKIASRVEASSMVAEPVFLPPPGDKPSNR